MAGCFKTFILAMVITLSVSTTGQIPFLECQLTLTVKTNMALSRPIGNEDIIGGNNALDQTHLCQMCLEYWLELGPCNDEEDSGVIIEGGTTTVEQAKAIKEKVDFDKEHYVQPFVKLGMCEGISTKSYMSFPKTGLFSEDNKKFMAKDAANKKLKGREFTDAERKATYINSGYRISDGLIAFALDEGLKFGIVKEGLHTVTFPVKISDPVNNDKVVVRAHLGDPAMKVTVDQKTGEKKDTDKPWTKVAADTELNTCTPLYRERVPLPQVEDLIKPRYEAKGFMIRNQSIKPVLDFWSAKLPSLHRALAQETPKQGDPVVV